jgi:hypothetical protein
MLVNLPLWLETFTPSERVALGAAFLVLIGVAGEYVVEIPVVERKARLKKAIKLSAMAVLLLGLAGDVLGIVMGQAEMATLNNEASHAEDRASEADERRVELVNRILSIYGPRQVSPAQSERIAGGLTGLSGTKVDVYVFAVENPYNPEDFEDSKNVGLAVVRTLRQAHIDAEGWLLTSCHGAFATNVVVATRGDAVEDIKNGSQLIKAFQPVIGTDPNVETSLFEPAWCAKVSDLEKGRPNKRKDNAEISMIIGRKIQPILTREMLELSDERQALTKGTP